MFKSTNFLLTNTIYILDRNDISVIDNTARYIKNYISVEEQCGYVLRLHQKKRLETLIDLEKSELARVPRIFRNNYDNGASQLDMNSLGSDNVSVDNIVSNSSRNISFPRRVFTDESGALKVEDYRFDGVDNLHQSVLTIKSRFSNGEWRHSWNENVTTLMQSLIEHKKIVLNNSKGFNRILSQTLECEDKIYIELFNIINNALIEIGGVSLSHMLQHNKAVILCVVISFSGFILSNSFLESFNESLNSLALRIGNVIVRISDLNTAIKSSKLSFNKSSEVKISAEIEIDKNVGNANKAISKNLDVSLENIENIRIENTHNISETNFLLNIRNVWNWIRYNPLTTTISILIVGGGIVAIIKLAKGGQPTYIPVPVPINNPQSHGNIRELPAAPVPVPVYPQTPNDLSSFIIGGISGILGSKGLKILYKLIK